MLNSIRNGKRSAAHFQYFHNGTKAILKRSLEKDLDSVNYSLSVIEYGEFVPVCYQYKSNKVLMFCLWQGNV